MPARMVHLGLSHSLQRCSPSYLCSPRSYSSMHSICTCTYLIHTASIHLALLNSLTLPSNCHSISMSREVHTLSGAERICIHLRDLYWNRKYKRSPSTLFLQQLCSSLLQHNLLLTPPSIRTITFHTGSQTHTLTVPNDLAVLNISFEKSKQSLCFRRLHWMG